MTKNARHKSFGRPVADDLGPLTFDLYDETFECRPQIQGNTLLTFVKQANSEDGSEATDALLNIFKRVMKEEEYERFEALCTNDDTVVPVDTLGDIVAWLMEQYSGRPTPESQDS